ncbi:MAG: TraR/DksA family transcriptional regulator [Bdellovibrio sp.]|nr:TraR/DksA family transcriptional regulator [Bdellovibrio sp.]
MVYTAKYATLLESKRRELLERIHGITKDKTRREGPLDADFEEQATMLENAEVVDHLDSIERQELAQIEAALRRIKDQEYGLCQVCQEEISEKRLLAIPYATTCLNCSR